MKNHTKFYGKEHRVTWLHHISSKRHSKGEVAHVAMLSNFFAELPDNLFYTNNEYSDFKDSIITAIDIYHTSAKLVIDLFESEPSTEEKREIALIGFQKYIEACHEKLKRQFLLQLMTVCIFALYGMFVQFFIYEIQPDWPQWILNCIDITGWVTIWQFFGFWAFEFSGQHQEMQRLIQISKLKFNFKKWE